MTVHVAKDVMISILSGNDTIVHSGSTWRINNADKESMNHQQPLNV